VPDSPSLTAAASRLRPAEGREAAAAVGAVSLGLAAWIIELRMTQWALGPRFVVAAAIAGVLLAMGWTVPRTGPLARPHQSLLLISGLLVLIIALQLLGEILAGHHHLGAGGEFWTLAVQAGVSAAAARRANSAGCTLIAAFAAAISLLAFVGWAFHPHGFGTFRWILLVESLALAVAAIRLRTAFERHAVQLVNVAGLLALFLVLTFVGAAAIGQAESRLGTTIPTTYIGSAGAGWKLYALLAMAALIAYAVVNREPAPGVIGAAIALSFAVLVGLHGLSGGSLVFWPLFLLIVGGIGVAMSVSGGFPAGPGAGPTTVVGSPPPPAAGPPPPGPGAPPPSSSPLPPAAPPPPSTATDPPGPEAE
jgi:hypothetical protein